MKRLCIFCFFDRQGIADESVEYLLNDLKLNADRLIIAVNGKIDKSSEQKLLKYTKEIVKRDNKGFDAGAYKHVLFNYLKPADVKKYDELILCNDTFFGPFVPFSRIFENMAETKCDFWGINSVNWSFMEHIQSFFLVFRDQIIQDNDFYRYWEENIDENTQELEEVYAKFEAGLFWYLTEEKKKSSSSYVSPNNCDIYVSIGRCIRQYKIPLIKKKALKNSQNKDNIMDALQYLYSEGIYPVEYIISYADRVYGVKISEEEVKNYTVDEEKIKEKTYIDAEITTEEFKRRLALSEGFYIYGTGIWARKIYWNLCRDNKNFKGFIVSDLKKLKTDRLYGYKILQFDKVNINKGFDIVLGVNKANTINILTANKNKMDKRRIISIFPRTVEKIYEKEAYRHNFDTIIV